MDTVSVTRRSEIMAKIRSKDTVPELRVRRCLHRAGLRYRLHNRLLPGKPDLILPSRRICVFVHGCFWHGCRRCVDGRRAVKSNRNYWSDKVAVNRRRDRRVRTMLRRLGWRVITVWECQTTNKERLEVLAERIKMTPQSFL